jgi:hypothetical protein
MANALILGLINNDGFTAAEAKQIFRYVRDEGYSLNEAKKAVILAKTVDLNKGVARFEGFKAIEVQDEPDNFIMSLPEDVEAITELAKEEPEKPKKRKRKSKGKKK